MSSTSGTGRDGFHSSHLLPCGGHLTEKWGMGTAKLPGLPVSVSGSANALGEVRDAVERVPTGKTKDENQWKTLRHSKQRRRLAPESRTAKSCGTRAKTFVTIALAAMAILPLAEIVLRACCTSASPIQFHRSTFDSSLA